MDNHALTDPIFHIEKCPRCRTDVMPYVENATHIYECTRNTCHIVWVRDAP